MQWPNDYAFPALLVVCLTAQLSAHAAPRRQVVFLSLHSWTSLPYSVDYVGAPTALAVAAANARPNQSDVFSVISWNKTSLRTCGDVQREVVPYAADMFLRGTWRTSPDDVFVILAPACSEAVAYLGDLGREWNVPVITSGGTDTVLDDKARFPTLLRLSPYQQQMLAELIVGLLRHFAWRDVALLCDEGATELNTFALICKVLPQYFKRTPAIAPVFLKYNFRTNPDHARFLTEAARSSRVLIISTHGSRLRQLLVAAARLGMDNGDYAFIALAPFVSPFVGRMSWRYGDADDSLARSIYRFLLLVASIPNEHTSALSVYQRMKEHSLRDYGLRYEPDEEVTLFASGYYLGVEVMAEVLAAAPRGDRALSGANLSHATYSRTFNTALGDVHVNAKGDLDNDYGVKALLDEGDHFQVLFRYMRQSDTLVSVGAGHWPLNGTAPPNRPLCGFDGLDGRCREEDKIMLAALVALACVVTVVLAVLIAGLAHIRYQQLHNVDWIIQGGQVQHLAKSAKTLSVLNKSRLLLRALVPADTALGSGRVGTYRGHCVWCRWVVSVGKGGNLPRAFIKDTNVRKRVKHANLAEFMGVMVDGGRVITLTEYFAKGSLDDLIETKPAWMDGQLKNVFLTDILNGLSYIHASEVKAHGALKSPNCMVTGQLSIKLTDFGHPRQQSQRLRDAVEKEHYKSLLWTAPEILRSPHHRPLPTPEGDMYALGIIFYEILYVSRPYGGERPDTQIIHAVTKGLEPPYRPPMDSGPAAPDMEALMQECWAESAAERPKAATVRSALARLTGLRAGGNFMELVLRKLQDYAHDLEEQVAERTVGLLAEKKRSEDLLRTLLPGKVVEELVRGVGVEPEMFGSATVAFGCIYEFGRLVADATPWQCIALLNDFFSSMDRLIGQYDVYKVETISDTYMLASGVPLPNGIRHAEQIGLLCCSALALMERQCCAGRKLSLQMGMHSGQLAAGLVGLRMLRYCLFGDTVNLASRMTSTSLPKHLQTTEPSTLLLSQSKLLRCQRRGQVQIKGKGAVETFWVTRADL